MPQLNLSDKKILVVEDDEMNFIYLSQIFKIVNAGVIRAKTGKEAIEICTADSDFDIIMMDMKLPDIDGIEVTKIIRKKLPDVLIIAQTASRGESDKDKMMRAGCTDFITKPFKMEEMIAKLSQYFA